MAEKTLADDIQIISKRWKDKKGSLIMALHDLQERFGYIPRDGALELARQMGVPLARIYEVITFYNYFKLKAPGKHIVSVCLGTACYMKGAEKILEKVSETLGVEPGHTTPDGEFHLQVARCLGCCGLAPVVTINEELLAKVKPEEIGERLCKCKAEGKGEHACHD